MELCTRYGFFQISGEDINSPRQSFLCEAMRAYPHLLESTYALIGHEQHATAHLGQGMFSPSILQETLDLQQRVRRFAALGRQI